MHHFSYKGGVLHAEDVSLVRIAADVGTPFYCYSSATLTRHYKVLAEAFSGQDATICFAVKANSNQAVLATMARLGAGMDVVSEGELRRARAAGTPAEKIIFAGVGKTRDEMAYALREGIQSFNVESEPELEALSEVAAGLGVTARVAIRVNPDVDAKTHAKISTGKSENKFGIPYLKAVELYADARRLPALAVEGIHMHIGSQITDLAPFRDAFRLMRDLTLELRREGHEIRHLDIGGGLGVPYRGSNEVPPHPDEYAALVKAALGDLGAKIYLEPGRMIAGNAGILVTRVVYVKQGAGKRFTIVDGAMNDLIRPTLYEAYHEVWPVTEALSEEPPVLQDIVGPVCETGDYLALERKLAPFEADDLVAVMTAGAYGAVMSSTYNTRPLVPEVLVNGAAYEVVRARPTYDELIGLDRLPEWLAED
ncbi:diaminopimelate decarboxylase [Hyphomicrobium nitrativorans NL23]|uniref:Diaminopimelate decarboxylase n=1 Tax=Hyphomicrobium nitrativorans NL23 TaxID=1029756 RepID=V5SBY4_9HYPH|nr:diaminopimelate decarboxylase [Hyphomicrobium nitrativorans]AHB47484.1 diaminopimelate decarboxylase [Hyphomicrobium nitrativorans NL23]